MSWRRPRIPAGRRPARTPAQRPPRPGVGRAGVGDIKSPHPSPSLPRSPELGEREFGISCERVVEGQTVEGAVPWADNYH